MTTQTAKRCLSRMMALLGIGPDKATSAETAGQERGTEPVPPTPPEPPQAVVVEEAPDAPPPPQAEQVVQPAALDEQAGAYLDDIRWYASWSGADGARNLDEVRQAFLAAYPGNESVVAATMARGQADAELCNLAYHIARRQGPDSPAAHEVEKAARGHGEALLRSVRKSIKAGGNAWSRAKNAGSGGPLSSVQPRPSKAVPLTLPKQSLVARRNSLSPASELHANDVRAMPAASKWRVLVDETGNVFDSEAGQVESRRVGRFVALALPGETAALAKLPPRWHAADCDTHEEIDRVVQAVLEAEAGVLGISVTSLPITPGERWADGVALLIDWLLRLIPVDGPTQVEVLVEQRGIFSAGQSWELVVRESLRHLALAFPHRAALIDLSIKVITKDGSPLNGYVDALAFTWAAATDSSKARLAQSGLCGTCLLEHDPREFLNAWDAFAQGVHVPAHQWWQWVGLPAKPSGLLGTYLDNVGSECRADKKLWTDFLHETRQHMAAGAVDVWRLGAAVDWLQRFQPDGGSLPPMLRLMWLTACLARANHMGVTESAWSAEIEQLSAELVDEAAPLVCHADLHRAVAFTNRFDFENAQNSLARWPSLPPAVPGLQHWGQVQSSLGQHAAFRGQNQEAVQHFQQALHTFQRLSDPAARGQEASQTSTYLAIALMDTETAADADVLSALEAVTGPVRAAVERLASDNQPASRYAHHVLLRWLVQRGDQALRDLYLSYEKGWQEGLGHPWPLIQLYRGMLAHRRHPELARNLALDAADRAFAVDMAQGPTVRLIGACCRAVAAAWGEPWRDAPAELSHLKQALPLAGARIDHLAGWLAKPGDPLPMLRQVLPFNFR